MPTPSLRLLLLDDHQLFRAGLRLLLEREPGYSVVGQAGDVATALAMTEVTAPDLILADVHLPGEDGISGAAQILAQNPSVQIIFLSSDDDVALVRRALDCGGRGYLLKENAPQELLHAIHAVRQGGVYLSPQRTAALLQDYQQAPDPAPVIPADENITLSARENAVLRHIAEGLRNKEIADRLQISQKSVETYRSRLLKKLGYSSTAEIVRHAIREGLITA